MRRIETSVMDNVVKLNQPASIRCQQHNSQHTEKMNATHLPTSPRAATVGVL